MKILRVSIALMALIFFSENCYSEYGNNINNTEATSSSNSNTKESIIPNVVTTSDWSVVLEQANDNSLDGLRNLSTALSNASTEKLNNGNLSEGLALSLKSAVLTEYTSNRDPKKGLRAWNENKRSLLALKMALEKVGIPRETFEQSLINLQSISGLTDNQIQIETGTSLPSLDRNSSKNLPVSDFSHNGINFNMTKSEVEKKGFVCNPSDGGNSNIEFKCEHMDMTGVAFGFPTKDYRISIGSGGKVDIISAEFDGRIDTSDYFSLHSKIQHFFPTKNEAATLHEEGMLRRDEWISKDNVVALLTYVTAIPPFTKQSLTIAFRSPRVFR